MSELSVVLKGSDADIELAEQLVAGINNMYKKMGEPDCLIASMREERLEKCLADESGENEAVKAFVSRLADDGCLGELAICDFSFDRSEKRLWIGLVHDCGTFNTEVWTHILADTLQCRSLFFYCYQYSSDCGEGRYWAIYEDEKLTVGGDNFYQQEDDAFWDEDKYNEDEGYVYKIIETLCKCSEECALAEFEVWQLKDSPGPPLEDAKAALETAKKELEEKERLYYGGGDSAK
jgi:hypothetical protein